MGMSANNVSYVDRVRRNFLTLNDKVAAIRRCEIDPVYMNVSRYFNCSPVQIKRIIKDKNEILMEWNKRTKKSVVPAWHETKSVMMSLLGKAVYEWIRRMMYYTDFNLTNALIMTMAIEFKKSLELQTFSPDLSWVMNFRNTYNLKEVNTKDLDIGYQESHSVQIRDILRHLRTACAENGESAVEPIRSSEGTGTSLQLNEAKCKEEPDCDVEMKCETDICQPTSSTTAMVSAVNQPIPATMPILLPAGLQLTVVSVKSEEQPPVPAVLSVQLTQQPAVIKVKSEEQPPAVPVPISIDSNEQVVEPEAPIDEIHTHSEAINCVKVLEELALLKENFRLIGLIERLEEALAEKP